MVTIPKILKFPFNNPICVSDIHVQKPGRKRTVTAFDADLIFTCKPPMCGIYGYPYFSLKHRSVKAFPKLDNGTRNNP